MQATVRMDLVNGFKHQLQEGNAVTLQRYSLGEIQPKFRIVTKPLRLSFLSNTLIEKCLDFTGSIYGFDFRPFSSIIGLKTEEVGQFGMYIRQFVKISFYTIGLCQTFFFYVNHMTLL